MCRRRARRRIVLCKQRLLWSERKFNGSILPSNVLWCDVFTNNITINDTYIINTHIIAVKNSHDDQTYDISKS
jgi:hypothetical protein